MNYGLTDWECDCLETKANFKSVEQIMEFYDEGKGKDEELILSIKHFGRKRYDKVICAVIDCLDAKKNDSIYIPALNLTAEKDFPEKEDGTVDVQKVSNNILTKDELADIIINLAMDLIEGSDYVESLNKAYDSSNCKNSRLFVSQKRMYIEKTYLESEFNKKVKNMYIDTGEARNKYFEIALSNSGAVAKKFSIKLGKDFLYTRKAFSPNKENYVEIDIIDAENQVNRIFNNPYVVADYNYIPTPNDKNEMVTTNKDGIVILSSKIPSVQLPTVTNVKKKPVYANTTVEVPAPIMEKKPETNGTIFLILSSMRSSDHGAKLWMRFKMYNIIDTDNFDIEKENSYMGEYYFDKSDKENGDLMISGLFEQYETIKRKVLNLIDFI
jgi:hypothetical protein